MTHVLCIGAICVDHVLELDRLPDGEGKQAALGSRWGGGGPAATAAVAISRLGARATWCGTLGDDPAGEMLANMLVDAGVEIAEGSVVPAATTSYSEVLVDSEGHRWLGFFRGDGLDEVHQRQRTPPDLESIDALMTDQGCPELAGDALKRARERGLPRVLDLEQVRPGVTDLAELANHVVFSANGIASYTGIADPVAGLEAARAKLGGATLAVTLGPAGSVWLSDDGLMSVKAPKVRARDTTGCGDVFHGAYALGLGEGLSVERAARFATAVAALKAERGQAWIGMPGRTEVDTLLQKGWV